MLCCNCRLVLCVCVFLPLTQTKYIHRFPIQISNDYIYISNGPCLSFVLKIITTEANTPTLQFSFESIAIIQKMASNAENKHQRTTAHHSLHSHLPELKTLKVNQHRDSMIWFYWHPSSFIQIEIKTPFASQQKALSVKASLYMSNARLPLSFAAFNHARITHYRRGGFFTPSFFTRTRSHTHTYSHFIVGFSHFVDRFAFRIFSSILLSLKSEFLCQVRNIVSTKLLISKRNFTIPMYQKKESERAREKMSASYQAITFLIIILLLLLLLILIITIAINMIIAIIGIGFTC